MNASSGLVAVDCPYCRSNRHTPWAEERGYHVVRCADCAFLYVNPAPPPDSISDAVRTGFHGDEADGLDVRARRLDSKVAHYRRLFGPMLADIWARGKPIRWLDVGAGYGELVEAISGLAPVGSIIEGLEPMEPKAKAGRARGLAIKNSYLTRDHPTVDFVSSINVFSHIPDYRSFLADVKAVLNPGGEMIIETGNLADVAERHHFAGELGLPDHLTFAGKAHLAGFLEEVGLRIVDIEERRSDGLVNFAKGIVKKMIGRPGVVRVPYTSSYRQLIVRARLAD